MLFKVGDRIVGLGRQCQMSITGRTGFIIAVFDKSNFCGVRFDKSNLELQDSFYVKKMNLRKIENVLI